MTVTTTEFTYSNTRWVLAARPTGVFHPASHARLLPQDAMSIGTRPEEDADKVVIEVTMLSVDAFLRTMLDDRDSLHGKLGLGDTLPAIGYGRIIWAGPEAVSGTGGTLRVGAWVQGLLGAQTYACVQGKQVFPKLWVPGIPATASLGLLGLTTGMTAYVGVHCVAAAPRRGETVVVSAAAGAVGSVVCQLAKQQGARVIGIAGGPKKCDYLRHVLGCDEAIDYKDAARSLASQLDAACPDGIDFFFDNVGGELLDLVLCRLRLHARIIVCGAISQYSGPLGEGKVQGPKDYLKLAEQGASMHGFVVTQYILKPWTMIKTISALAWGYFRGTVVLQEQVDKGIEAFPEALEKLFTGGHVGKMLVDVSTST